MTDNRSFHSRPETTLNVTRGTRRLLAQLGFHAITELSLKNGRRVDLIGLNDKGKIIIVEVKSSKEDFQVDEKWEEYLPFCDQFYFAVSSEFPTDLLPPDTGFIVADAYGAEIIREATNGDLNPARRKALTIRIARMAAKKVTYIEDSDFRLPD
ncbi:DNA repair protein MmcB-related protein [Rhodospirillaceae bacterium RKSG073]|nr:DNA repair protein MmcB-related protein [Curvivirga aplysinae]